jgi:hypothetical protein
VVVEARVERVEVPPAIAAAPASDYASAFALTFSSPASGAGPGVGPRSAEQWSRAVFEGAPPLLRSCILFGWRFVLGLRLQPSAADRVLGWAITAAGAEPDTVTLAADSRLLRAENIVAVDGAVVEWVTVVHYESRLARPLWAVTSVVHHRVIPSLLRRAARGVTMEATMEARTERTR